MEMLTILQLDAHELTLASSKNSPENCLAFGVMLKHFQLENRYPQDSAEIDPQLLKQIADQLNIKASHIELFDWESRTTKRFRKEIREYLGYREATDSDRQALIIWLMKEHLIYAPSQTKTLDIAYEYFQEKRIEPFSDKQLQRYVSSAHAQFEQHFFTNVYAALSKTTRTHIDSLLKEGQEEEDKNNVDIEANLDADDEEKITPQTEVKLRHLKKDIPGAILKHVEFEHKKMAVIKQLALPHDLLSLYPHKLIKKYYLRILVEQPSLILRRAEKDRYAMMALFLHYRSERLFDNLGDMFIQLTHKMRSKSENFIKKNILSEVTHVNGKFDILYKLANISSQYPTGIIQEKIYPIISQNVLNELITDLDHRGKWYQGQVQLKIHSLYAHGSRPMLLMLLGVFDFQTHL